MDMVWISYQILLASLNQQGIIQVMQRYASSYASSYLSRQGQQPGPVKLQPENIGRPPPLPEPVTGGGGTLVRPRGARSCQGLRAVPLTITNNLTTPALNPMGVFSTRDISTAEDRLHTPGVTGSSPVPAIKSYG